ncbi:MAG: hypothetical protein CR986_03485 [Ignavibacteriae bacterium]|nr:MAG: hypothetical protein CR986_03485 [Ignavibacteriota bacterium]
MKLKNSINKYCNTLISGTKYFIILFIFAACSQLSLIPSDFTWTLESVLDIDSNGNVKEERYSFSTNVKQLFFSEMQDSNAFLNSTVRIIRDEKGYYYFISEGFKNVYLFKADDGAMVLHKKITVSEFPLDLPAFNQRKPYIEILDGEKHLVFVNSNGIKEN